jgi:hypothetical protein
VVLPLFSKWLPLPCAILSFLVKPLNNNVVVCRSFTWFLNCDSITSNLFVAIHGLSTTVKQRQLEDSSTTTTIVRPSFLPLGRISKSFLVLSLSSLNTTFLFFYPFSMFPNTLAYTLSYLWNIQETCI